MENQETKRQELASRLVEREVVCCISMLVSGLAQLAGSVGYKDMRDALGTDQDELIDLCQRPDYEQAAEQFVMDDADVPQLEGIADENGYWSDVLEASNVPEVSVMEEHEDGTQYWGWTGGPEPIWDDEDEAREAAIESVLPEIRKQVWAITTNYQEIVEEYGLDCDYVEAYEHWAVSSWLKGKLAEKGEIVGDLCDFDVWGRCCTGQSMTLDSVIQDIAWELWGDE